MPRNGSGTCKGLQGLSRYLYGDIYDLILLWVEQGRLRVEDKDKKPCAYDKMIMDIFGFEVFDFETLHTTAYRFNEAILDGDLDVEWIFSPHGLALLKAMLIRRRQQTPD